MATRPELAGSLKLKMLVDKKNNRVMFAEAKKDFVDLIFHILSLPLGAVQRILAKYSSTNSLGSIGTIQKGLMNLDDEYIEIPSKDYLLGIKAPYWGKSTTLLLPDASWHRARVFKPCMKETVCVEMAHSYRVITSSTDSLKLQGTELDKALARGNEKGYVKDAATFMVMDDLVVRPAEPASIISLMNQHSINDVRDIEKREVTFGTAEAIKLLKASISSTTVLTDVFLAATVKAEK